MRVNSNAFWERGPGKYGAWRWLHEHTTMLVLVPDRYGREAISIIVHTDRMPDDWSKAGPVKAWNGEADHPTLDGSLLRTDVTPAWPVFLRAGEFVPAGPV